MNLNNILDSGDSYENSISEMLISYCSSKFRTVQHYCTLSHSHIPLDFVILTRLGDVNCVSQSSALVSEYFSWCSVYLRLGQQNIGRCFTKQEVWYITTGNWVSLVPKCSMQWVYLNMMWAMVILLLHVTIPHELDSAQTHINSSFMSDPLYLYISDCSFSMLLNWHLGRCSAAILTMHMCGLVNVISFLSCYLLLIHLKKPVRIVEILCTTTSWIWSKYS